MTGRVTWVVVGSVVVALAAGVLLLDRYQARRGAPSLLGVRWLRAAPPDARVGAAARRAAAPADARPRRIALIVDELGGRADVFERVLSLGRPVTVAVLPALPLSRRIAREAGRAGHEVLLQVPLEPYRFPELDPGPGVLLTSMSPDEVTRRTRALLGSVPGVVGVLTGMGSRFTEDDGRMRALLDAVRGQGLLFVDSLATHRSVGYDLARALGLRAARRQVFLDPDESEATVRARLLAVERWAERRGSVIVIGHGRLLTVRLLAEAVSRWEARGLRLVPVSQLATAPRAAAVRGRGPAYNRAGGLRGPSGPPPDAEEVATGS